MNGNLIFKTNETGTASYSYDYENRLTRVIMPDGTTSVYTYDPFGRRISKSVSQEGTTSSTYYLYDNEDILFEYDATGAVGNRYIHGPGIDEPLAVMRDKGTYYYHADGLGSITAMTDSSAVVQTYEYDSYGKLKDQKNRIKQPYAFTGREWDREVGLYFHRARYRDPEMGIFISFDPLLHPANEQLTCTINGTHRSHEFSKLKPFSLNPYTFALNNPISFNDPTGLFAIAPAITVCLFNPSCAGAVLAGGALLIELIRNLPPPQCEDNNDNYCTEQWIADTKWCDNNFYGRDNIACHAWAQEELYRCLADEPRQPFRR